MDVCAEPEPQHAPEVDPAEEAAFYGVVLKYLTEMAVRIADKVEPARDMTIPQKVAAVATIATVARRNAVTARFLHEPIRTEPPRGSREPRPRDYPRKPDGSIDYRQLDDAELDEIIEREKAEQREKERREARERVEPLPPLPKEPDLGAAATDPGPEPSAAPGNFQPGQPTEPPPN